MNKRNILTITGGILTTLVALLLSSSVSAWGPERPTYTNNTPADHATFNSITDNVAVGDERNFVRVREIGSTEPYSDEIEVEPGKEYEVYIYYHNNAASNTNAEGYGVATNVKVSSAYPTFLTNSERGMISGLISWSFVTKDNDNAETGTVWDEAYLTTKTDGIVMRYKTGTATIHNGGKADGSILSPNLFTKDGIHIGYNKLNGVLPGCAEYSGYITYTLVAEKTDTLLEKEVSLDGENWSENVKAEPGDYVTYRVTFRNTGNTNITNAIFKDIHDDGLKLKSGSIIVFNNDNTEGKTIDDILDISGYNVGDVASGSLVQIIYQAQVIDDQTYCSKTLNNTISLSFNSDGEDSDDATVTVKCEEETCETNPDMEGCEEVEKTCITNPEMEGCQELPNTGPVEIIMAIVIVSGIAGGGYYLYRTQKTLKTVEENVSGKDDGEKKAEKDNEDKKTEQ